MGHYWISQMNSNEWQKRRMRADIVNFQNIVTETDIVEVDIPTGRKDVEVAFERNDRFHVEEGVAIGVYYEPGRMNPVRLHIDWADDRDRLTLSMESVVDMTEGEYYIEDREELSG